MASAEHVTPPDPTDPDERALQRMETVYDFLSSHRPFREAFQKIYDRMYDKIVLDEEAYDQRYNRQG